MNEGFSSGADFHGSETILYDTLMVDMWHSINTFGKTYRAV